MKKKNNPKIWVVLTVISCFFNITFIVFSLYSKEFQPAVYLKEMFFYEGVFNWSSLSTIAATIAVGISIFGFWWNYRATLKHNMFKEKLEVYREYINNIGQAATAGGTSDIVTKNLLLKQEMILFGSERVALLISELGEVDLSIPWKLEKYYELINEMRFDLLDSNSRLDNSIIKGLLVGE